MSIGNNNDGFDHELIDAEFESMVEGLSLDQSSPTTYLDELDQIEDADKFIPPIPPKKSLKEQFRAARKSFLRWKENGRSEKPEDGAVL